MKKLIAILLAVFVLSTAALAAGHGRGGGIRACVGPGRSFPAAIAHGVCDHYGAGPRGRGRAYVDADGDGVCDRYGTGRCGGTHCGWAAQ